MKPTDLPLNQALGIVAAPAGSEHLLELPFAPIVQNHVQTMHAAAQFALAEAASAACLQRDFPGLDAKVFAVMRGVQLKYRKPTTSDLLAFARPDALTLANLVRDLELKTRTGATVLVELKDRSGNLSFAGNFDWFIARADAVS